MPPVNPSQKVYDSRIEYDSRDTTPHWQQVADAGLQGLRDGSRATMRGFASGANGLVQTAGSLYNGAVNLALLPRRLFAKYPLSWLDKKFGTNMARSYNGFLDKATDHLTAAPNAIMNASEKANDAFQTSRAYQYENNDNPMLGTSKILGNVAFDSLTAAATGPTRLGRMFAPVKAGDVAKVLNSAPVKHVAKGFGRYGNKTLGLFQNWSNWLTRTKAGRVAGSIGQMSQAVPMVDYVGGLTDPDAAKTQKFIGDVLPWASVVNPAAAINKGLKYIPTVNNAYVEAGTRLAANKIKDYGRELHNEARDWWYSGDPMTFAEYLAMGKNAAKFTEEQLASILTAAGSGVGNTTTKDVAIIAQDLRSGDPKRQAAAAQRLMQNGKKSTILRLLGLQGSALFPGGRGILGQLGIGKKDEFAGPRFSPTSYIRGKLDNDDRFFHAVTGMNRNDLNGSWRRIVRDIGRKAEAAGIGSREELEKVVETFKRSPLEGFQMVNEYLKKIPAETKNKVIEVLSNHLPEEYKSWLEKLKTINKDIPLTPEQREWLRKKTEEFWRSKRQSWRKNNPWLSGEWLPQPQAPPQGTQYPTMMR